MIYVSVLQYIVAFEAHAKMITGNVNYVRGIDVANKTDHALFIYLDRGHPN